MIKINKNFGPVNFVSAYFQFAHPIEPYLDQLQVIIDELRGQMVLIGADANAHSRLWYSGAADERGDLMHNLIERNDLIIVNKEHQPATHKSGTSINLTLSSRNLADRILDWRVREDASLSDHWLITFTES